MRDSQSRSPTRSALAREWHPHSEASLLSLLWLWWCDPASLRSHPWWQRDLCGYPRAALAEESGSLVPLSPVLRWCSPRCSRLSPGAPGPTPVSSAPFRTQEGGREGLPGAEREQIFQGKISEADGSPIMFGSERG